VRGHKDDCNRAGFKYTHSMKYAALAVILGLLCAPTVRADDDADFQKWFKHVWDQANARDKLPDVHMKEQALRLTGDSKQLGQMSEQEMYWLGGDVWIRDSAMGTNAVLPSQNLSWSATTKGLMYVYPISRKDVPHSYDKTKVKHLWVRQASVYPTCGLSLLNLAGFDPKPVLHGTTWTFDGTANDQTIHAEGEWHPEHKAGSFAKMASELATGGRSEFVVEASEWSPEFGTYVVTNMVQMEGPKRTPTTRHALAMHEAPNAIEFARLTQFPFDVKLSNLPPGYEISSVYDYRTPEETGVHKDPLTGKLVPNNLTPPSAVKKKKE
jgi:hypothetical protein